MQQDSKKTLEEFVKEQKLTLVDLRDLPFQTKPKFLGRSHAQLIINKRLVQHRVYSTAMREMIYTITVETLGQPRLERSFYIFEDHKYYSTGFISDYLTTGENFNTYKRVHKDDNMHFRFYVENFADKYEEVVKEMQDFITFACDCCS